MRISLMLGLGLSFLSAQGYSTPWSFFKGDTGRTSLSADSLGDHLTKDWDFQISKAGRITYSSPITDGLGQSYIAANSGIVYAFKNNPTSLGYDQINSPLWSFATDAPIFGSPAFATVASAGKVFVGSTDGNLYCLDATSGLLTWKQNLGGAIFSSPIVVTVGSNQLVLCGSNDGSVRALRALDGVSQWTANTSGYMFSSPAFDSVSNQVFAASYDGKLYAFDAVTGVLISNWPQQVGPTRSTPAVVGGKVFNLAVDGTIKVLNAAGGVANPSETNSSRASSSIAVVPSFGSVTAVYGLENGHLIARSYPSSNVGSSIIWDRQIVSEGIYSSPTISNGKVYVGANDGNLYILSLSDGSTIARIKDIGHNGVGDNRSKPARVSAAVSDGFLLIASSEGSYSGYGVANEYDPYTLLPITPTATFTGTATSVPTLASTSIPTVVPTPIATATSVPTAVATLPGTPAPTSIPTTAVPTSVPTTAPATAIPTAVATAGPATTVPTAVSTPVPTVVVVPTNTPVPTAVPPTVPPTPIPTPTYTVTTVPTPVPTPVPPLQVSAVNASPSSFSPHNGQSCTISFTLNRAATVTVTINDKQGGLIRQWSGLSLSAGSNSVVWDGKDSLGHDVPPGLASYNVIVSATAGTESAQATTSVTVAP
jgi:outer membrane protein assembly factor BamB